jgi:hypothetical protein
MVCTDATPPSGGAALALFGTNQIKLRSANVQHDSVTGIFGMDVTVENLLTYTLGTPDGQTRFGLKVFFETGPTASYFTPGDTGTVQVRNPDGYQNITGAQQPYHLYDTILEPQQITAPKRWEFSVPPSVKGFGFTVRIFTATEGEQKVPLEAPDLTPAWFGKPEFEIRCYGNTQVRCLSNVVRIGFHSSASQEERQSAVDMVRGRVVGGDGGFYYVRVPSTGTFESIEGFIHVLERLPQVEFSHPYPTFIPIEDSYLIPHDTLGWREWQLNPDSADGANWALERIGAPFAWGCSTGDTLTAVAVVDRGFHDQPDLRRNLDVGRSVGWNYYAGAADTIDHGTSVTAALTARGNDTSQITGTMWRSSLRVYDRTRDTVGAVVVPNDPGRPFRHIRRAGEAGARVINLSWGLIWIDSAGRPRDPRTEADTAQQRKDRRLVAGYRNSLESALDRVTSSGNDPVVVIAAGNSGMDAEWSGLSAAAAVGAKHANRILVVGASNAADSLPAWSNHGTLVEVAAPGTAITALWGNGTIATSRVLPSGRTVVAIGTSLSAPLVSGVAGLLFSFDPRLTAAEVKQLVLDGARRGNRVAGTLPILNAHQSLILAGRRPGAPLCGNRLWMQDGSLYAQRDTASPTGELLFTVTTSGPRSVTFDAVHGGKDVHLHTRPTFTARRWTPTGWTTIPFLASPPNANGSFLSRNGYTHDRDSRVSVAIEVSGDLAAFPVTLHDLVAGTDSLLPVAISDSVFDRPGDCIRRFVSAHPLPPDPDTTLVRAYNEFLARMAAQPCTMTGEPTASANARASVAFSPRGHEAFVLVVRTRGQTSIVGSQSCVYGEALYSGDRYLGVAAYDAVCRSTVRSVRSAGTVLYRIDLATLVATPVAWGEDDAELFFPTIREDGRELTVQRSTYRFERRTSWTEHANGYHYPTPSSTLDHPCRTQFRDVVTGVVRLEPATCRADGGDGTFSSNRW